MNGQTLTPKSPSLSDESADAVSLLAEDPNERWHRAERFPLEG